MGSCSRLGNPCFLSQQFETCIFCRHILKNFRRAELKKLNWNVSGLAIRKVSALPVFLREGTSVAGKRSTPINFAISRCNLGVALQIAQINEIFPNTRAVDLVLSRFARMGIFGICFLTRCHFAARN